MIVGIAVSLTLSAIAVFVEERRHRKDKKNTQRARGNIQLIKINELDKIINIILNEI